MDDLLRRLIDYVRMSIEAGETKPESGIGIAYHDYISQSARQNINEVTGHNVQQLKAEIAAVSVQLEDLYLPSDEDERKVKSIIERLRQLSAV